MNVFIRPGRTEDAAGIAAIGRVSFIHAFQHLFLQKKDMEDYVAKTYTTERIAASLGKSLNRYYVCFADDRPVGFAKLKKGSSHPVLQSSRQCELQRIYLLPEFHGSGAGQLLMNEIIKAARQTEAEFLWLDVHIANEKAKRFYYRNQFSKAGDYRFTIGTQEFHYDVMRRAV